MYTKITSITVLIILSIIVWFAFTNGSGKIIENHPNGSLKITKEYKNNEPYGTWTSYRDNGSKLNEIEFMPGSLMKSFRTYHSNGRVKNSMVALTSWPEEFTKGRDSVNFIIESYDDKGNRIENRVGGAEVEDDHKGVTYQFPWFDGSDVVGSIKTSQAKK